MARLLETDTYANKDISSAVAIGAYTANATRLVHVRVAVDQAAGNGDYVIYATLQIGGTGSAYRIIPITTAAAASGVTALMFVSVGIPMDNTDVLTVYIDGLAGDTTTPDTRVDFYEKDYLRPTVSGRTLDVAATGEASANVTLWKGDAPADLDASGNVYAVTGATGTYSYSNTVDDGSGNLLDGVYIILATDAGFTNLIYSTYTSASGAFTVYSDTAGTHYLRLDLAGYRFADQTVTLA